MHEYSITKQIVRIANSTASLNHAKKIIAVRIVAGENTAIIPESVQMYFEIIARGTPAEGAKVYVRTIKTKMWCNRCGINFDRPRFSFVCPVCGTLGSPTDIGNEFYVESISIEN